MMYNYSWQDTDERVLTPDRVPMADQSNDSTMPGEGKQALPHLESQMVFRHLSVGVMYYLC